MSNKEYPLHPGQTQASPYYVQVPQSEYEALKQENKRLQALFGSVKSQNSDIEIDTLASECRALRSMNAKAQEEIAALKEAQRWRKFTEETPEHHQWIEARFCKDMNKQPEIEIRRWDDGMKFDVFEQELYIGWRPMPKSPEDK